MLLLVLIFCYKLLKSCTRKMLKAINLYWLHNDASEKNNSLNVHSNEPRINEYRFIIPHVRKNLLRTLDHVNYKTVLKKFAVCLTKKLDALNEGVCMCIPVWSWSVFVRPFSHVFVRPFCHGLFKILCSWLDSSHYTYYIIERM